MRETHTLDLTNTSDALVNPPEVTPAEVTPRSSALPSPGMVRLQGCCVARAIEINASNTERADRRQLNLQRRGSLPSAGRDHRKTGASSPRALAWLGFIPDEEPASTRRPAVSTATSKLRNPTSAMRRPLPIAPPLGPDRQSRLANPVCGFG